MQNGDKFIIILVIVAAIIIFISFKNEKRYTAQPTPTPTVETQKGIEFSCTTDCEKGA